MKIKPDIEKNAWEYYLDISESTYQHSSKEELVKVMVANHHHVGRLGMERDQLKREVEIYERMIALVEVAFAMAPKQE